MGKEAFQPSERNQVKLSKKHIERLKMMIRHHEEQEKIFDCRGVGFVKGSIRATERLNAQTLRAVVKYLEGQ